MSKLDFSRITDKVAVWCKTEEEATAFCSEAKERGLKWGDGTKVLGDKAWSRYGCETCYIVDPSKRLYHHSAGYCETGGMTIIPYADLLLPEKPLTCGACDKTDGKIYTTDPAKVKCSINGEYHGLDDRCDQVKKPVEDWTLREAKEYCEGRRKSIRDGYECEYNCPLNRCGLCCCEPRDMVDEVADAKAVTRFFKAAHRIRRISSGGISLLDSGGLWVANLPDELFPSILPGQFVAIADIIKNEKEK